ncbi:hypothetical protein [Aquisalimonas sp. 2447]|nr:hypothetical protein [Aquisalimonas sp. 2447]
MSAIESSYRRCQALSRVGSRCRITGAACHALDARHEALLCPLQ